MRPERAGILIIIALWAGCSRCPDGRGAGTSAGCGNPIKTAELQTISQNGCVSSDDCHGSWPSTIFHVAFGDSLSITLTPSINPSPDSTFGAVYLFEGDQIPVFDKSPVDSLFIQDHRFLLTPKDLAHLRKRGGGDSSYCAFSAYVRLSFYKKNVKYNQAGLLAGLVYDWNFGSFSYSNHNPLGLSASSHHFLWDSGGYYKGVLSIPDSILKVNAPKYVYIPGSPFFTIVNDSNGRFSLSPLPLGEADELRFFAMPITNKHGESVPVYRLESDSGVDSNRVFELRDLKESVALP